MDNTKANLGAGVVLDADQLTVGHSFILHGRRVIVDRTQGDAVFLRVATRKEVLFAFIKQFRVPILVGFVVLGALGARMAIS